MNDVPDLVPEVYTELRRLARRYVARERAKSVQATELVHEAFLRLARDRPSDVRDRNHFLALAAIAMRRLLVERARARRAAKRGGDPLRVTLTDVAAASEPATDVDVIALDRALDALAAIDPEQAKIVELRYFAGMTVEETAASLGISPATVKRHWTIAKAWLKRALDEHAR